MRPYIRTLIALLAFAPVPASAVTLIADNADVFVIQAGDSFEHVIQFETSNITMTGGSVPGHFLMLDASTATFTGGSVGDLTVLGDALATVVIQTGSLEVDGVPTPEPTVLDSLNCPGCTVSAILENGDPVGPTPVSALQSGQVQIQSTVIPEPHTVALFGIGLLGLGVMGLRRPLA